MSLLSTKHINAIFNKIKTLVFGTNNIADGAITKEKIDANLLNEITSMQTDSSNLKNLIIYLPDDIDITNVNELDITNSTGLYVADFNATVGNYNFIRKLTNIDIVNLAINGCTITLLKGNSLIETELAHFTSLTTRIDNDINSQICSISGIINQITNIYTILLVINFDTSDNYTITYFAESKDNINPVYFKR